MASLAVAVLLVSGLIAVTSPLALGAEPPCRVRNVTQDTAGTSFFRMGEAAQDGDRLRVSGTCRGTVVIERDLVITGRGDGAMLTAQPRHRVLKVGKGATVTLRNLVITGGRERNRGGGGIYNRGTLTLTDSVVRGNTSSQNGGSSGSGGGILNRGTLTLTDSVVRGNTTGYAGAGIDNRGTLTLTGSVVRGNTTTGLADGLGGGIDNGGTLTLTDSVVRGNTARYGGGIDNYRTLTLDSSRVAGNRARRKGGGIHNLGTLLLTDSFGG